MAVIHSKRCASVAKQLTGYTLQTASFVTMVCIRSLMRLPC